MSRSCFHFICLISHSLAQLLLGIITEGTEGTKSINELLETKIYFSDFRANKKFFDDTDFVIKDLIKICHLFSLAVWSDVVM